MSLLDVFKKKKVAPASAGAQEEPVAQTAGMPPLPKLKQWLLDQRETWAACDAKAPECSETTPDQAQRAMEVLLPLSDAQTVAQMQLLLLYWSMPNTPITVYKCRACGFTFQIVGNVEGLGMPAHCRECGAPVESHRVVYSRQVGVAMRDLLAKHERCVSAFEAAQAAFQAQPPDLANCAKLVQAAATLADREGHAQVKAACERIVRLLSARAALALAATAIDHLKKDRQTGSQSAPSGESDANTRGGVATLIQAVINAGYQCADAHDGQTAVILYESAVKLRADLIALWPNDFPLRLSQACDLDELGMALRDSTPNRRPEALGYVRQAADLLDALDRDNPAGKDGRCKHDQAIRLHLKSKW